MTMKSLQSLLLRLLRNDANVPVDPIFICLNKFELSIRYAILVVYLVAEQALQILFLVLHQRNAIHM